MLTFENSLFYHIRFVHFKIHAFKVLFYQTTFRAHFEQHFEPILRAFVLQNDYLDCLFQIKVFVSIIKKKYY